MITDAADFCRYTRSRKDMWWGTMLAGGLATALSVSLGAMALPRHWAGNRIPFRWPPWVHPQRRYQGSVADCDRAL